ncbi:MAG: acyltransferase [Methylococcales bacterium]|nr:acyltransferase [Methylococcales bacterium]
MEIRKLNMLRGIAALIVIVSHYSNKTNMLNGVLGYGAGQFGVMLFFILSGFLMSYLYMNKEVNKNNVKNFAVARIARVIPLFLLIVLLSYLFQMLGIKDIFYNIPDRASLISHIALLSGDSVLWTIAPEIQFYVLFVFLWLLSVKRIGYLYFFISLIFIILIVFDFPNPTATLKGLSIDTKLIRSLPYFFVGVVFGQLHKSWTPPDYLQGGIFVFTLLIIPFLYPKIFYLVTGNNHEAWQDVGILFIVSFVFFSLVFLVPDSNILLSNFIGDFLGKVSYSLYLLHLPVLHLMQETAKSHAGVFLIVFVITSLFISYLSYLVVESPSRRAIRSIASNKRMYSDAHSSTLHTSR